MRDSLRFDFVGDGDSDILLRNSTTGELELWKLEATELAATAALPEVDPDCTRQLVQRQLQSVNSHEQFLETPLELDVSAIVPRQERLELDALPKSALVYGDRVPLDYEIEDNQGVVRMRIREGQARRLRAEDLPDVDRPLRFTVVRGKRAAVRASDLDTLHQALASLPRRKERHQHSRKQRRRRRH